MQLDKIYLSNFRNFDEKLLEFSPDITVIVGDNAVGKTNILEAIHVLSTGKSFKVDKEEEMVAYDSEVARVKGLWTHGKDKYKPEVVLTRGVVTVNSDTGKKEKVARKRLLLDGVGKRLVDFAGNFKTVLFAPQDMDIVTESPSIRRKFLDNLLSQVDREYRRSYLSYNKALRRRNKILEAIREDGLSEGLSNQLDFWNKLLIKHGDYIAMTREEFIDFANTLEGVLEEIFSLKYDKSAISEARLEQYAREEVAAAKTLVGPHRDDFIFFIQKEDETRELDTYGSRGEQRMGVLWLKMAELAFIEDKTEEKPLLLLDDIFSELDHEHRELVFEVAKDQQTIITTADPHFLDGLDRVEKIEL